MTYSLDTSALLRILTNEPRKLAANVAIRIQARQRKGDLFSISDLVLAEAYFALQYHYNFAKEDAIKTLKFIANTPGFVVSDWTKDILSQPGLDRATPGFVDRMIHGAAFASGQTMLSCEKSFRRLLNTEIVKETDTVASLLA